MGPLPLAEKCPVPPGTPPEPGLKLHAHFLPCSLPAWGGGGEHGAALHSPKVAEMIEHGLFVKRVLGDVDDDGTVHKVAHPVGPPFWVQGEVPVGPAGHVVQEILGWEQGRNKGSTQGPQTMS